MMMPAACCSLLVFTLLCHIQCQLVQSVEYDIGLENVSIKGLLTSDSEGDPHTGGPPSTLSTTEIPPSRPPSYQSPSKQPASRKPTNPPTSTPKSTTSPPTNPPTSISNPSQSIRICDRSLSTARRDGVSTVPCQGEIMLEHQFNTLNGWSNHISIGGNNTEDEFTCFTKFKENTFVKQGRLNIKPTLLEERSNDSFVRHGELYLSGCTLFNHGSQYCHRKAYGYNIFPPVESARISTRNSFTFRYGTVEIRAKLPRGDWLVPELWLEPTSSAVEEKIVVGVSTGNTGETSYRLAAGVVRANDYRHTLKDVKGSSPWFEAGFRTYKLEWTRDNVKFFVDEYLVHELPTDSFAVFSQEVYISLGVHAGGGRDFPDDLFPDKPWNNVDVKRVSRFWDAKRDWYPTWNSDSTLQVEYIRVTAL